MTGIEKQRLYILRILSSLRDCPNCAHRLNYFDAMFRGGDVDAMDLTKTQATDHVGTCPSCKRGLLYTLPFIGDWYFRLVPAETDDRRATAAFFPIGHRVRFDFPTGRPGHHCVGLGKVAAVIINRALQAEYDVDAGAGEIVRVMAEHIQDAGRS